MKKPDQAAALFEEGFACSQAVLATFCERFGLDRHIGLKLAEGFSGGIGRQGLTCGAVTGALMVIGLRYGRKKHRHQKKNHFQDKAAPRRNHVSSGNSWTIWCKNRL